MRLASYASVYQMVMILYLFVLTSPLGIAWQFWIGLTVAGSILVLIIDIKWIFPASQGYMFEKNPEWVEFVNRFEEMEKKVNEIYERI